MSGRMANPPLSYFFKAGESVEVLHANTWYAAEVLKDSAPGTKVCVRAANKQEYSMDSGHVRRPWRKGDRVTLFYWGRWYQGGEVLSPAKPGGLVSVRAENQKEYEVNPRDVRNRFVSKAMPRTRGVARTDPQCLAGPR